jgi:hypothetical protein
VAGDLDCRSHEATRRFANRRERFGKNLIENLGGRVTQIAFDTAASVSASELEIDLLALRRVGRDALLLLSSATLASSSPVASLILSRNFAV